MFREGTDYFVELWNRVACPPIVPLLVPLLCYIHHENKHALPELFFYYDRFDFSWNFHIALIRCPLIVSKIFSGGLRLIPSHIS
jgi:hypothetical protein